MYTLPMASVAQYQLVTGQGAVLMQVPAGSVCLVRLSVILFGSLTHVGGCRNYGPFLGTLKIRCRRIIIGIQKRTIILTTTHVDEMNTAVASHASGAMHDAAFHEEASATRGLNL